jgi:ADP-ribosyl-[dinitrogen reductase] hydrolase
MVDLLQRYRGALVGVHVGDSLGAPYETWGPKRIAEDIAKRGKLEFFNYPNPWETDGNGLMLPAGRPTDDSDQTADLASSLIAKNGFDAEDLFMSLQGSVIYGRSRLWSGRATGSGGTTRKALSDDPEVRARGLGNNIGTNGSLMRSVPIGLWIGPGFSQIDHHRFEEVPIIQRRVDEISAVTHAHPHAKMASWLYTRILTRILAERGWMTFSVTNELERRIWSRLNDEYDFPYDPGDWPGRGTAEFSLYVALYALMKSTSFESGIEIAIRVGGDTDTYAAIAGGLLGAYYGYDAIPIEWRTAILGHYKMVDYASILYLMRMYK